MKALITLALFVVVLTSCETQESARYDVYFWPPSGKELLIGNVRGLAACQITARNYAAQQNGGNANYNWTYICCLNKPHNSCAEKHR